MVRGAIVVAALLLLVIVVTQIVLWTNYPKRLVIGQVQRTLGLLVAADSLSTGWFGNTTLRQVTLALPLADEAFVVVPEMQVSHTSLVMMLILRKMEIDAIALDAPRLIVRQDESGRWNLQELAELLGRVGGGKSAADAPTPRQRATQLPSLDINDATVRVIDRAGRESTIEPVSVHGRPVGAMAWEYDAVAGAESAGERAVTIEGRIAPGDAWKHQVDVAVRNVGPWLAPWIADFPEPARLTATWEGQVQSGVVAGRAEIEELTLEQFTATGAAAIRAGDGSVIIQPSQLIVRSASAAIPELALQQGEVRIDNEGADVDRVQFSSAGGIGLLNGRYGWTTNAGEIHARWQNILLPGNVRQSGTLDATLATAWPNRPLVTANLTSAGDAGGTTWNAHLKLSGDGPGWREMNWRIKAPQLVAHRGQRAYHLDNFEAVIGIHGDVISLDEIIPPRERMVRGGGEYHLRDGTWWFWLHGDQWIVPVPNDVTISLSVDAFGNREMATLRQFFLDGGDLELTAHGYYVFDWPEPVGLYVYVNPMGRSTVGAQEAVPLTGQLWSEAWLTGTAAPPNIAVKGWLFADELAYGQRKIGDVQVDLAGTVNSEIFTVRTKQMEMFGGNWELGLRVPMGPNPLAVDVAVQNLNIAEAVELANLDPADFAGTASGEATFTIRRPALSAIEMTGNFTAENIKAREIIASTGRGKMNMRNGVLTIQDVELQQDNGVANAHLTLDLTRPRELDVELTATDWPVELERARSSLVAREFDTKIHVNLEQRSVTGPVNVRSTINYRGESLGEISLNAGIDNRRIDLKSFRADAFSGEASGSGVVPLDDLKSSQLFVQWNHVDTAQLAKIVPIMDGISGTAAGVIQVRPAPDPRAIEPIEIHVELWPASLSFRGMPIGDAVFTAYANQDRARIVLQHSRIHVAEGVAEVWARISRQRGEQLATHVMANFADLNLDQLLHAAAPESESMPGRVSGSITMLGNPRDRDNLYGQGSLQLRESELANSDIIGGLYDAMRLNIGPQEPSGHGDLNIHLERSQLQITQMRYFNRGVEARLNLTIDNVWKAKDAPISGFVVGTVRPLANIRLPLISDADVILSMLQQFLTTVGVSGDVGDPEVSIKAFDDVTQNLRELILGDVQN